MTSCNFLSNILALPCLALSCLACSYYIIAWLIVWLHNYQRLTIINAILTIILRHRHSSSHFTFTGSANVVFFRETPLFFAQCQLLLLSSIVAQCQCVLLTERRHRPESISKPPSYVSQHWLPLIFLSFSPRHRSPLVTFHLSIPAVFLDSLIHQRLPA